VQAQDSINLTSSFIALEVFSLDFEPLALLFNQLLLV